jgi:hypothetical protein
MFSIPTRAGASESLMRTERRIADQNRIAELEAQIVNKFRSTAAPLIVRRAN